MFIDKPAMKRSAINGDQFVDEHPVQASEAIRKISHFIQNPSVWAASHDLPHD
jgi:hypothetical protein